MPRGLTFPLLALVALICVRAHAVIDTGPELPESARRGPVERPHASAAHRNARESGRDDGDHGDEIVADVQQPEEGDRIFPSYEESESYKELKCGKYDVTYEQVRPSAHSAQLALRPACSRASMTVRYSVGGKN